jgi:hypothetical protein
MNVNIALSLAIASIATLITGLAGHLAATKMWHKWIFWGGGLGMLVLIGIQTYNNQLGQNELRAQLNHIQTNTETPPKVEVNVPPANMPAKHVEVVFELPELITPVPPKIGQTPELNIRFRAVDGVAGEKEMDGAVVIIPTDLMQNKPVLPKYRKEINKRTFGGALRPGALGFYTFAGKALNEQDVSNINSAKAGICALGILTWSDQTGSYETYEAQCYVHQPDGGWQWVSLVDDNHESKIQ